ncbi:phosphoenolpyruvate--protein phosphotransferase [Candidatus Atribacteria bacterium 1244-E10-H5-B2]|nr:MAG: phosphoenolpyruvate--protein phosphotransferase [Candidatus Atribacteria bacterium 1244-E10-H5-B2]
MKKLQGIGVSKGICIGKAFLYIVEPLEINNKEKDNIPVEKKEEILQKSIKASEKEIQELYKRMKAKGAGKEAEIFQAHLLFLEDPIITKKITKLIGQGFSIIASVSRAFEENANAMEQMENIYFRERAKDIRDVSERLIRSILHKPKSNLSSLPYPAIVVARDLTTSDTASLDKKNVLGFVTEVGGITSHTAILAEALGIPAVVGAKGIMDLVKDKDILILDGNDGEIIIEPDGEALSHYKKKIIRIEKRKEELEKIKFLDAITKEGKRIEVSANIGKTEDADIALQEGAEGVGLFRTEFLFLNRMTPPTEEEQFEAYKMVLEKFKGKSVIIRTLDIGGDKQIPALNLDKELNPFLGVRAIRLCLIRKELFKTQLRAILRASIYGRVRIMYPMIAIKEEIEQANKVLEEVKAEIIKENIAFDKNIEVGIMIEIPSAALSADELADYVDFFSIGTNDLMQYTFAADRTNQNLNYLYNPLHPAMLQLIKMTIDASHKKGKWTGICGELAGDPEAIPKLVEMGIDELSMSPSKIPEAKKIIRNL